MNDDVDQAIKDIRARGEELLDGFEDLLTRDELQKLLPHLEELKHRQDDLLAVLEEIRGRRSRS